MPKDNGDPLGDDPSSSAAPLRRGDACLYCRKRRIRCNAAKPSCAHCVKLKRECVYDVGKPVSRVKQLEDKVAELEELLRRDVETVRRGSGGAVAGGDMGPPPVASGSRPVTAKAPAAAAGDSTRGSSMSAIDARSGSGSGPGSYPTTSKTTPMGATSPSFAFAYGDGSIDLNMSDSFDVSDMSWDPAKAGFQPEDLRGQPPDTGKFSMPNTSTTPFLSNGSALPQFDFSMLDPGIMNLVNSLSDINNVPPGPPTMGSGSTGSLPTPANASEGMYEPMDLSDPSGSTGMTPFLDLETPTMEKPLPLFSDSGAGNSDTPARSGAVPYQAYVTEVSEPALGGPASSRSSVSHPPEAMVGKPIENTLGILDANPPLLNTSLPEEHASSAWKKTENGTEGLSLVGGWFDAADLPPIARDHLLDIFFSCMRVFGQEFHVPRFFASLTLPPSRRPHPCLLYAIYLLASRISTSPSIKALEPHFYSIASRQLEESIAKADRLLDAVRAATMLSAYKYSVARYFEGMMMTGQAMRLAIACGLHQIPSSIFKVSTLPEDARADLVSIMRQRGYVIPPPKDPIELGERIWAFWAIYLTERCGTVSSQWPSAIADKDIITPFPKPLYEYEVGLVSTADDISLDSIYAPVYKPLPHYADSTLGILRIRAICILERTSKLQYERPEPGWEALVAQNGTSPYSSAPTPGKPIDEYLAEQNAKMGIPGLKAPSPMESGGKGWMRCARVRNPKAFEEVRLGLLRMEYDMPPEKRTNWEVWDGGPSSWLAMGNVKKDFLGMHFMIGTAWMFLFDVYAWNVENTMALNVARRMCYTIRAVIKNESVLNAFDVFISMCWSFCAKILIREAKRLSALPPDPATKARLKEIDDDIDTTIAALRLFGQQYSLAAMQAFRVMRYRTSTNEELESMLQENEDDEGYHLPVSASMPRGGSSVG